MKSIVKDRSVPFHVPFLYQYSVFKKICRSDGLLERHTLDAYVTQLEEDGVGPK